MQVKVIKAVPEKQKRKGASGRDGGKLRVAAYCRVSTDSKEQETSYEAQCRHYTQFINSNPEWELAGIYADEGITGTSTKRRERFNQMIADCEAHRIDLVITKSISRWARNTIDSLKYIRKLKDLGIPVIFEKENINTMDAKGEVLITIMSSLAQQESDSISKNVKLGIRYQMQQGKGRLNTSRFLGFTRDKDTGRLVIIKEEADIVRHIYRQYLNGKSPQTIASDLIRAGVLAPGGGKKWYQSTIVSILENEKYAGDLLMQKYFVEDFLTRRIVKNTGQLPQYFVEKDHEPIVPKEIFLMTQEEMRRRSVRGRAGGCLSGSETAGIGDNDCSDPVISSSGSCEPAGSNEHCRAAHRRADSLSGRIICGICGRTLKRYTNPDPDLTDYRCRSRTYNKRTTHKESKAKCQCRNVPEREIKEVIVSAFNELRGIKTEADFGESAVKTDSILKGSITKDSIIKGLQQRLLCELIEALSAANDVQTADKEREPAAAGTPSCSDPEDFFQRTAYVPEKGVIGENGRIVSFSDDMVNTFIDIVTVREDSYEVRFKAGIGVIVQRRRS